MGTHVGIKDFKIKKTQTNKQTKNKQRHLQHETTCWASLWLCWASLVAEMVKNLPAMQETWFQSLGREDPLDKGMATHSGILA